MFNFSEFCKEKKCEHYKEWHIQAGKDGMVRCCDLVGQSFYITTFPDNCIHIEEITARKAEEKAKHETWEKISTPHKSASDKLRDYAIKLAHKYRL